VIYVSKRCRFGCLFKHTFVVVVQLVLENRWKQCHIMEFMNRRVVQITRICVRQTSFVVCRCRIKTIVSLRNGAIGASPFACIDFFSLKNIFLCIGVVVIMKQIVWEADNRDLESWNSRIIKELGIVNIFTVLYTI
jgi:hypothetical protein